MKRRITSKKLAAALALAIVPFLTGCGSSNNNNNVLPSGSAMTACQAVAPQPGASSYPTLAIGQIPCAMPVTPGSQQNFAGQIHGGMTTNGCIPLGQTIQFSGSGAFVSGISANGQTFYSNGMNYGSYTPGNIAVTISGGNVSGTLQLSQYEISQIQQATGATCISGIALVGNLDTTPQYPGFEGFAALYVNNSTHGFITDQFFGAN